MKLILPIIALSVLVSGKTTRSTTTKSTTTRTTAVPTVKLDYTTLVPAAGNSSLGYYKYQNIRFAAAPTGDLRWAQPQWPTKEKSINNGSLASSSVACSSTEDCLFMDIWVPANAQGKKLPVMVWTYGGGFTGGSKNENTPEGLFNLSTSFIYVAYNYRLGITGLANGVTVPHEGGTTNTALWDVQHALQWTKKYISAFGGDPNQVTAVGFSAGASQVLFQLTVSRSNRMEIAQKLMCISALPAAPSNFSTGHMSCLLALSPVRDIIMLKCVSSRSDRSLC